jgi:hypothetical protein
MAQHRDWLAPEGRPLSAQQANQQAKAQFIQHRGESAALICINSDEDSPSRHSDLL